MRKLIYFFALLVYNISYAQQTSTIKAQPVVKLTVSAQPSVRLMDQTPYKNLTFRQVVVGTDEKSSFVLKNKTNNEINFINEYPDQILRRALYKGKMGFINSKNQVVIPFLYSYRENADINFKGQEILQKDDFWGVVNAYNQTIIPFENQLLRKNEKDPYILAKKNNKYGLYDNYGNVKIPFEHDSVHRTDYYNGCTRVSIVKNGQMGIINADNKILIPCEYKNIEPIWKTKYFFVIRNNDTTYIDETNQPLLPKDYKNQYYVGNSNFYASYQGKFGVIDDKGNIVVPFEYDNFKDVVNNLSGWSNEYYLVKKNNKVGLFDNKNKIEILQPKFDAIESIAHGYIWVEKDGLGQIYKDGIPIFTEYYKKNYLGSTDEVILTNTSNKTEKFIWQDFQLVKAKEGVKLISFENGNIIVENNKWGYTHNQNYNNDSDIPVVYDTLSELKQQMFRRFLLAKKDGKFGVLDLTNNVIVPFDFTQIIQMENHVFAVNKGDRWAIFSPFAGFLSDFKFQKVKYINNYALYFLDDKLYSIVNNELVAIPVTEPQISNKLYKYEMPEEDLNQYLKPTQSQYLPINKFGVQRLEISPAEFNNGKIGFVNKDNQVIITPEYDLFEPENIHFSATGHHAIIRKNGLFGIINIFNQIIIPFEFDKIVNTEYGYITHKNNMQGLWNLHGKKVLNTMYNKINIDKIKLIVAQKDSIIELLNFRGELIDKAQKIQLLTDTTYLVKTNNKYGVKIIGKGYLLPLTENKIQGFSTKILKIFENGKERVIDFTGKQVFPDGYKNIEYVDDLKVWIARNNVGMGVMDSTLKVIVPFVFDYVQYKDYDVQSGRYLGRYYSIGKKQNQYQTTYGIYDVVKKKIEINTIYEDINWVKNDLFIVKGSYRDFNNNKGVIRNGKIVVPIQYEDIIVNEGDQLACIDRKTGINKTYDINLNALLNEAITKVDQVKFENQVLGYTFKKGTKMGYKYLNDKNASTVALYDYITANYGFSGTNTLGIENFRPVNKYGLMNFSGELIEPLQNDEMQPIGDDDNWHFIGKKGGLSKLIMIENNFEGSLNTKIACTDHLYKSIDYDKEKRCFVLDGKKYVRIKNELVAVP